MNVFSHTETMESDYPLANTPATRMLAEGLARAKDEQGLSVRKIGKQMGYKTAVVLSHMATGRVGIPIDRARELASILDLDEESFLLAVLQQRHPDIEWSRLFQRGPSPDNHGLAMELEAVLGAKLKDLTQEQRAVMREVAGERSPRRRWLSVHELATVTLLRETFPQLTTDGLDQADLERIRSAIEER
ncbi:MAG TPA: hypothetical protein DIW45_02500 [Erythrobacter sp.]|nr:hypothetical protein [Erythrobacter sp.]|tara:strand:+ start:560 stop:1126 length:567 start_codon:yes stop_codon:yes gene_type:complete